MNYKWIWDKDLWTKDVMSMVINKDEEYYNKEYFSTDDIDFIEKEYKEILFNVFKHFNISEEYINNFYKNNITAKLIFYIQYFAGSPTLDAARMISYSNMHTFIGATFSKEICGHKKGLGLVERLQFLFRFFIYEKDIYLNCIAKVCLASLRDHYSDINEDILNNNKHNNPFLTEDINEYNYKIFEKGLIEITKYE